MFPKDQDVLWHDTDVIGARSSASKAAALNPISKLKSETKRNHNSSMGFAFQSKQMHRGLAHVRHGRSQIAAEGGFLGPVQLAY